MGQVFTRTALMLSVVLVFANVSAGQQVADPNFDPTVAHPAFTKNHPRVLFDEAHNNFHTAGGRYKAFVDLINSDGYRVTPNSRKFSAETLAGYDILVIANPLGAPVESPSDFPTANKPAFTEAECDAVRDWVNRGGSLLLIADHYPVGGAAGILAKRFEVDMSNAFTDDPANYDPQLGQILFSRSNKLLLDHALPLMRSHRIGKRRFRQQAALKASRLSLAKGASWCLARLRC